MLPLHQEIRISARTLLRAPLFSAVMVLTIALAIGANTAVFSVTHAVLLRSLPFDAPDRLVWITTVTPDQPNYPFSLPEFLDYREQARSLDALVAFGTWSAIVGGTGPTERVQGIRISSNAFDVLGVEPAAGRLLEASDDRVDAAKVAVLAFDTWQRRFGGTGGAIGTVALLNGEPFEIVGVLPRHFPFPVPAEIVVPLAPDRDPVRAVRRSVNSLRVIGRLRSGVDMRQAEAELAGIARRLRAEYPDAYATKIGVSVTPLHAHLVRHQVQGLRLLTLAVSVALLIACGNLANLLLARVTARSSDLTVRLALGATMVDVARSLWIETLLLAAVGGSLGVATSWWALRVLIGFGPADVPRLNEVGLNWYVLGFAGFLMLAVAMLLAVAPLWQLARGRLGSSASARERGSSRPSANVHRAVIIGQVALTFVLLLAAFLLIRSFNRLQEVNRGFPTNDRVVARIALPRATYRTPESVMRFADRFREKLEAIPGVQSAGGVNVAPLSGVLATADFTVEGRAAPDPRDIPTAHYRVVTDEYFAALGIPLVRGRGFAVADTTSAVPVAVINRHLAETILRDEDPIGRRIFVNDNSSGVRALQIVGVVGDVRQMTLDGPPTLDVYVPMRQVHPDVVQWLANNQFWVIETDAGVTLDIATGVRRALDAADSTVGLAHVRPLAGYVDAALAQRRFATVLSSALAAIALVLAAVGLYGVVAYLVVQRTREIGLRSAIGATRLTLWWLIARSALSMLTLGALAGLLLAAAALRPLETALFQTTAFDPALVAAIVCGLMSVGLAAAMVPACRAARIDPVIALRE